MKINLKCIKNLNVRAKTIKLSEKKNIGRNLHDLEFDNGFLRMTLKPQATKEKIGKLDFLIKI